MIMLVYNLRLALKSLRRTPVLSLLLVLAVALGTGVATTFAAVRHAFARNPIGDHDRSLRYVRLDSWDPAAPYPPRPGHAPGPPPQVTYQDAMAIAASKIPSRITVDYHLNVLVHPEGVSKERPFQEPARACFGDFFAMFGAPMKRGAAWTRADDDAKKNVVVLGDDLAERVFGHVDPVGKTLRLWERDFTVVGVLAPWRLGVRIYDLTNVWILPPEQLFLPLSVAVDMQLSATGDIDGWRTPDDPSYKGFLASENTWLQLWVELPGPKEEASFHGFLDGYAIAQRKSGRFERPLDNRLTSPSALVEELEIVPKETSTLLVVSMLFLAVCCVNTVGILLGKFLARAPEIGVRRALGASRLDVFLQHLVECEVLGLAGGALGLGIAKLGVVAMNAFVRVSQGRADMFDLDAQMLGLSVSLALGAGLLAGAYPAWRVCRVAPAIHLKVS